MNRSTIPCLAIHHVAIICSDYLGSKRFYCDVLGLHVVSEVYREERQSWKLNLAIPGGGEIELFSFPDSPERASYPEACGLRHLAFAVSDIDVAVKVLTEKGVSVEAIRIDNLTQARFTFFSDPDGLPIELYEDTRK